MCQTRSKAKPSGEADMVIVGGDVGIPEVLGSHGGWGVWGQLPVCQTEAPPGLAVPAWGWLQSQSCLGGGGAGCPRRLHTALS